MSVAKSEDRYEAPRGLRPWPVSTSVMVLNVSPDLL